MKTSSWITLLPWPEKK